MCARPPLRKGVSSEVRAATRVVIFVRHSHEGAVVNPCFLLYCRGFDPSRPVPPPVRDMIAYHTRGLRVQVNHRGELKRRYRITGVADVAADKDMYVHLRGA